MLRIKQKVRNYVDILVKLLPLFSIIAPIIILYFFEPYTFPSPSELGLNVSTFEMMWKGRTFYLFFLWIAFLEVILNWENLKPKTSGNPNRVRTVMFILALLLPTIYIVIANFYGLNATILNWALSNNIYFYSWMPLSTEYLVLAALFTLIITLQYGTGGLKNVLISPLFLVSIGIIYTIDNIYPYGSFTPFQMFVPTTATLSASVLTLMGYTVHWLPAIGGMPTFMIENSLGNYSSALSIAWPCSGIESLIIYAVVMLLFLRIMIIPLKHKIIYFTVGAVITFFVNVLRIVTLFVISVNTGGWTIEAQRFHDFYGMLYSLTWIVSYPLLIIGSRALWGKFWKPEKTPIDNLKLPKISY
jgi:thaumarchaeosortase